MELDDLFKMLGRKPDIKKLEPQPPINVDDVIKSVVNREEKKGPEVTEHVSPVTDDTECLCGHPKMAHGLDKKCTLCECEEFSADDDDDEDVITDEELKAAVEEENEVEDDEDDDEDDDEVEIIEVDVTKAEDKVVGLSSANGNKDSVKVCSHKCKCGGWWSHMIPLRECTARQYPGDACPDCVVNAPHQKVADQEKLNWEVTIRNEERQRCVAMDRGQLIEHIRFYADKIREMRVSMMSARGILSERMETEFTDSERSDFRKALKSIERRERIVKKRNKSKGNQREKAIISIMNTLGISHEAAERKFEKGMAD